MVKKLELGGMRFGMLCVVGLAPDGQRARRAWQCMCDCGASVVRSQVSLVHGKTFSCGCRKAIPNAGHFSKTHGATPRGLIGPRQRLYRIWATMKQRTMNPNAHGYERYGGVGVRMAAEWVESFEAFASDMGIPPSDKHTIDRIDGDGHYTKENCRWATYTEQNRNRKNTVMVEFAGRLRPLAEVAEAHGVPYTTAYMRVVKYGWPIERAVGLA